MYVPIVRFQSGRNELNTMKETEEIFKEEKYIDSIPHSYTPESSIVLGFAAFIILYIGTISNA